MIRLMLGLWLVLPAPALAADLYRPNSWSALASDRKAAAQQSGRENETTAGNASGMAIGFRLSSELVAGVLVGAVLGWACDHFLPTKPWGLIVFVLVGFVAGVINVMRAAGVIAKQSDRLK